MAWILNDILFVIILFFFIYLFYLFSYFIYYCIYFIYLILLFYYLFQSTVVIDYTLTTDNSLNTRCTKKNVIEEKLLEIKDL